MAARRILLIQTGGTIAMKSDGLGTALDPDTWEETLHRQMPELRSIAEITPHRLFLEDSSDLTPRHWTAISRHIADHATSHDGFVILHGTDTMAYTASALSFSLMGLRRPVILTGSQVPLHALRSDARRNVVNAVEMATRDIQEVAICFHDTLYRGNRATKVSIGDFGAFASPNHPALGRIGLQIQLAPHARTSASRGAPALDPSDASLRESKGPSGGTSPITSRSPSTSPFPLLADDRTLGRLRFDERVLVLKLVPGLNPDVLRRVVEPGDVRVILLEAFGSGNFPSKGSHSILPVLESWRRDGIEVVIGSQAAHDAVDLGAYPSGRAARDLGVLSAGDMTLEAALTKSMFLLGNLPDSSQFAHWLARDMAGERSL